MQQFKQNYIMETNFIEINERKNLKVTSATKLFFVIK